MPSQREKKSAQAQGRKRARAALKPTLCQWFLLCLNPAVTTMPHPVLGDVPICQRCADKVARLHGNAAPDPDTRKGE